MVFLDNLYKSVKGVVYFLQNNYDNISKLAEVKCYFQQIVYSTHKCSKKTNNGAIPNLKIVLRKIETPTESDKCQLSIDIALI